MAVITFGTLSDRQPGNPDAPLSHAQYDAFAKRGAGHDKDFYALYDSNADGSWDTAFELSDTTGGGRLNTLIHDDTVADPVTITATGRVGSTAVGSLTNDITYDNNRGFGVSGSGDDGAHVLNSGEAIDFALNPVGGQAQVLQKVSFVVESGEGEGSDDGHHSAPPVSVYLDFDGSTLARVGGHWQTSAAYSLSNVHDGDAIIIDFVNHTITNNAHLVTNVPAAFWAAYQAAGGHNLTIGSGADDNRGFAVDNLSLSTAPATVANHPALIGDPTVAGVTEDVNPFGGNLVATGTIPISDPDAGQAAFQTSVQSAAGNLGVLTLQANGAYTYSVANSTVQYLGATDSNVDTFTVTSIDGTQKQIAFTIHGSNDVAVIGGVAIGDVTEDNNPATLTTTGALTVSDADQGQSSFAAQAGTVGSSGLGTFSLDAAGNWTYTADNTQAAIQQLGAGQTLTDSFTAVSSDGSASQLVTVTIHGTNDVAVIGGVTTGAVTEDSNPATLTTTGALTVSDADQGQSSFAAQAGTVGSSGLGTFSLDVAGHWTYTADDTQAAIQQLGAGQTLTDSFTAVSSDGSASHIVTVTIHGMDDAPVTAPVGLAPIAEDSGPRLITQADLLANASDIDGPNLSAANLQIASGSGSLTDNGNGTWSYTPAANDDTAVSFSYQVTDGTLGTPGSATLDITPVNDAPAIAIASSAVTVDFDSLNPGTGSIDGVALSGYLAGFGIAISSSGSGADPTVADDRTIYGGGIVAATTGHNVIGEGGGFPVSYTVSFAHPLSSFAFDRVTENPGPSGSAYPQWTATAYDSANHVLGTVGESATSIFPFNGASPAVHYTLNGPQIDHVTFTGNDNGFAAFANVVTDSWILSGTGGTTTAEDTPLALETISISDVDAGNAPIQVSLGVGNGALSLGSTAGLSVSGLGSGAVLLTGSQSDIDTALASGLTYTPSSNYNGGDTLIVTANDLGNTGAGGALSSTQSIDLAVTPVNDPAVISGTSTGAVLYDAPPSAPTVTGTLTDTDIDNPANTFQTVTTAAASDQGYGTFTMTAGGTWSYTLNTANDAVQALNAGEILTDSFTVHTADGTAQQVTVTINGANDAPVITSGPQAGSVAEDQYPIANDQLTASDVDHNDTFIWSNARGHSAPGDFVAMLDEFKATSASGVSLDDTFDGTVPLSGVGSPYGGTITTTIPEVDGHAVLEGSLASINSGFAIQNGTFTTPTTANGSPRLSQDTTFDATARYDFVNPDDTNELYGVRLTDRINSSTGVDTLELSVRRDLDGHLAVQFRHIDLTTNQANLLGEVAIDPAQLAGSQIALHLAHTVAGSKDISAYFDVIDAGGNTTTFTVPGTGQVFTVAGEDWTRAQFIAREPAENVSTVQGQYGNLTVDQQGHWQYLLNDKAANVQALAAGQHVTDGFDVVVTDSHGAAATEHVSVDVAGTNDAPVLQALGNGTQSFDQTTGLALSGIMAFADVDLSDVHSVTLQPQGSGFLGSINALVGADSTGTGNGTVTVTYALTPAEYQAANGNIPATQNYLATLTDNNGLSSTQLVSIPLAQIAGSYFTPPDNPPVIAGVQTTSFVLDSNGHTPVTLSGSFDFTDLDQLDHHTLSMDVQPVGFAPAALGTLNFSFAGGNDGSGSGAGTVNWTYTVDPSTWPGGVIHHEYLDIKVTDGAGQSASHTLDIDYEPGATTTSSSLSVKAAGTAQEGQTLTALAAGNDAGAVLTYQWQSSADNGTTWSAIAGATAPIYAVQESDENSIIRVIATDAADSVNTYSAPTAPVVDVYPASASVTISGLAKQGQTLDANLSVGTDSDLGTATFQWQVSTDNGQTWTDIAGATGVHYTATETDENNLLRVSVIATDDTNQSISLVSAATAPVLDNVSATIQGNTAHPAEGQILTASFIGDNDGNGSPNTFEWQGSGDNGATWTNIAGATAQTYQVQETDEGHLLRVIGHGVEIGGDPVSVASNPTGAVVDVPLAVAVTVTGTAQEGQTLTAQASTNDADAVVNSYQWQSSADNGTTWANITGATASTYTPVETDENHLIRVAASAQDPDGGAASANSAATAPVLDVTSVAAVTIGVGSGLAVQGAQSFSKFLGFGDSNIDSGYFFTHAISNSATLQNQYNAAVAAGGGLPTSIGGTMNSQLLAADYGLTANAVGEPGGTNYAASGATVTGSLANSLAPSVTSQIQTYLASTGGIADPNALYLISGGGNDSKIAQTLSGQAAQFAYMDNAANALVSDLSQLQAAGAKYIVIDDGAGRSALVTEFNAKLWAGLDAAGVHYLAADDSTLVRQITNNPAPYGITNTVQPPGGPFTAGNPYSPANGGADIDPLPNQIAKAWGLYATTMQSANAGQTYLWADNEHVTAAGQLAIANYTHNLIQNGVPTPGEVLTANAALVGETDNGGSTFSFQWQHSFDDGNTWSNIANAAGKNYTVAAADDGARLRVAATTADDAGGVYTAVSPETYAVSDGAEAPTVSAPSSLSAAAGGSVGLPITVTAADADDVLGNVTISGLPGDITMTDSNSDALVASNGTITLTQAELAGLTLHVGSTAATLSITADASEGGSTATSAAHQVTLDVSSPLSVSNFITLTAPGSLNGIGSASDINNAGIVVGNDETYDNITIQGGDGWLYQNGSFTFVHIGNQNNVSDINDYGVLAGFYSPNNSTPRYGFIENGVGQPVTTIDLSPNVSTDVEGINDSGDYIGSSYLHGGNTYSAFSVVGGTLTFFNPFGSNDAHANGINNAGDIVGTYGTHSYLEHNGVFTNIDVPGATQTAATDINNAGQIVGVYWDAAGRGHGYIETNGVVVTVDNPLGTNSTGVYGINDAGQVAGNYYDASNSPKAFIATINNPSGAATDDVLVANPQGGTLVGGAGNDSFVFTAAPQTPNTIADFTSGHDVIQVSAFGFGGALAHGAAPTVLTGMPAAVTNAAPGGDFILDNSNPSGATLYWDANGGSGADATAVAVLHGVNALLPTDFHVV
ncbi:MAG TPA: VCBS domain-containing protein [Pseudolabrys sp.]|nr:VCBS domain-containing protein [Pseudolabrys sp.]